MPATAAARQPLRVPGSMPMTGFGPRGGSSSSWRTFSAKTWAAAASAASFSVRWTSFSTDVRTSFLNAMRPAWRSASAPGASGTVQARSSKAAASRASNSGSSAFPATATCSSPSDWPRRTAR